MAVAVAVTLAQLVLAPNGLVLLVITEERTGLSGVPLFAARVTASLAAGAASYWLIERRFGSPNARMREPSDLFADAR